MAAGPPTGVSPLRARPTIGRRHASVSMPLSAAPCSEQHRSSPATRGAWEGGGKGYRPVDHSGALETMGGGLAKALRAAWMPKITSGWFFRAESFFSVARFLDRAAVESGGRPPDFLSHSHGEGFLRFFEER